MPSRLVPVVLLGLMSLGALAVAAVAALHRDIYLVSPNMWWGYLGVPLCFAGFCLAGLLVKRWRPTVLVVAVSTIAAVVMAEFYLELTDSGASNDDRRRIVADAAAAARGDPIDNRRLAEVIADLRRQGKDAYPTFSPTQFLLNVNSAWRPRLDIGGTAILPLTSVAHTSSVYCNESGRWLIFDSDRYGFNNPDSVWDMPTTKLALVGDSFAQGACVQPNESPAALLRATEPSTLTVGVGGTGPLLQLAILKEYLTPRRPATVFWLFYEGNDIHVNLDIERRPDYLRQYLQPGFRLGLPNHTVEIDRYLRQIIEEKFINKQASDDKPPPTKLRLRQFLGLLTLRERLGLLGCPTHDQDFGLLYQIFAEARRTVESWGGRLVVVYLPVTRGGCDLFKIASRKDNWLYDDSLKSMERAGIPVIDLKAAYVAAGSPSQFYFYPGSHLSPQGYRFVVTSLTSWLAQHPQ